MDNIDAIFGPEFANDAALYRMCDQGVREHHQRNGIWFKVMPTEVDKVEKYMAKKYPNILFRVSYPAFQ